MSLPIVFWQFRYAILARHAKPCAHSTIADPCTSFSTSIQQTTPLHR